MVGILFARVRGVPPYGLVGGDSVAVGWVVLRNEKPPGKRVVGVLFEVFVDIRKIGCLANASKGDVYRVSSLRKITRVIPSQCG